MLVYNKHLLTNKHGMDIKENTHFMFSSFFENRAVYDTLWTDIVVPGMPRMTAWRTRIAWWVAKAASTQDMEYLLLFHCNNGWTNAPECFVIRTLPVLL
jgi:hypothetical protein